LSEGWQSTDPFQKLAYLGPMFRYEKPQKGRSRQFSQFGVEALGSLDPSLDAEVIALAWSMMDHLGLGGLWLRLNSIGCADDRARYRDVLRAHFATDVDALCPDCRRRLDENPLRILDCKEAACQPFIERAPGSADHLCPDCAEHFATVRGLLDLLGLSYEIDPRLVRGLDYYTRTVFELMSEDLGAQDTLLGGGRYDGLIETLGGPPTPGVGFAGGFDRLVLVLREREGKAPNATAVDLFLAALGEDGFRSAFALADRLRREGIAVEIDHRRRGLRKQLDLANRVGAQLLLVLGDDEVRTGRGALKTMATGEERTVPLTVDDLLAEIGKGA
jgi:histidyl-tRNA synthetase